MVEMPPFLKMPREIRNQIYGYLLSTKYTKIDFRDEEPVSESSILLQRSRLRSANKWADLGIHS